MLSTHSCPGLATSDDRSGAVVSTGDAGGEPYLVGIREFHWGETESFGPRSYRLRLAFSDPGECDIQYALAGEDDVQGYRYGVFLTQAGSFLASTSYASDAILLSAGPVDLTNEESGTGGAYASTTRVAGLDVAEQLDITIISRGNSPGVSGAALGFSVALSVECQHPFDVIDAKVGNYSSLSGPINLDGVVAGVAVTASVEAAETVATIPIQDGGVFVLSSGIHAGAVSVDHPGGQEQYVVFRNSIDQLREFASGSGDYRVEVIRVGALPGGVLNSVCEPVGEITLSG